MIATDFDFSKQSKVAPGKYKVKLFGRVSKHSLSQATPENRACEFFGMAPCIYTDDKQMYTIAVQYIDVP
jgi:hypothetical protein